MADSSSSARNPRDPLRPLARLARLARWSARAASARNPVAMLPTIMATPSSAAPLRHLAWRAHGPKDVHLQAFRLTERPPNGDPCPDR